MSKSWSKLDEAMLAKGWVRVSLAAEKTDLHITTIYRAIENGDLQMKEVGRPRMKYVSIKSVIKFIGEEAAQALGLMGKRGKEKPFVEATDRDP